MNEVKVKIDGMTIRLYEPKKQPTFKPHDLELIGALFPSLRWEQITDRLYLSHFIKDGDFIVNLIIDQWFFVMSTALENTLKDGRNSDQIRIAKIMIALCNHALDHIQDDDLFNFRRMTEEYLKAEIARRESLIIQKRIRLIEDAEEADRVWLENWRKAEILRKMSDSI